MKKTLMLLVASTALTAAIGVPAWSAMQPKADDGLRPFAALFQEDAQAMPLLRVSDDDDDDDRRYREGARRGYDDDDDEHEYEDDDDDCDDDDDDDCRGGARNPAPAGTVAPPQNGLFQNGTTPKVQVN